MLLNSRGPILLKIDTLPGPVGGVTSAARGGEGL
jgi:hypothetical protein